jgi:hypothetical protein
LSVKLLSPGIVHKFSSKNEKTFAGCLNSDSLSTALLQKTIGAYTESISIGPELIKNQRAN